MSVWSSHSDDRLRSYPERGGEWTRARTKCSALLFEGSSHRHLYAVRVASTLSEAVEAADAHAPGTTVDAVPVCVDGGAEVAAADGLGVEERHDECMVVCRNLCRCEIAGGFISSRSESAQNARLLVEECRYIYLVLLVDYVRSGKLMFWVVDYTRTMEERPSRKGLVLNTYLDVGSLLVRTSDEGAADH